MKELTNKIQRSIDFWTEYEERRYRGVGDNVIFTEDIATTKPERIAKNVINDNTVIQELINIIEEASKQTKHYRDDSITADSAVIDNESMTPGR